MFPPPPPFAPPQPVRQPQQELPPLPSSLPKVGTDGEDFSFSDLQRVQHIEDKANEVLLITESNTNVLNEMKKYYKSILASETLTPEILQSWKSSFGKFDRRLDSIINDLHMQHSRVKTLLKLLEDRKNLVYLLYFVCTINFKELTSLALWHS